MSVDSFSGELKRLGLNCDVEQRGGVAVVRVDDPSVVTAVADRRGEIVELAKANGFATAAVELTGDAALLRD